MEHDQNQQIFQYTYSAKEQEELEKIRNKYMPREESKLDQLYRMDAAVSRTATTRAVTLGLIGALTLGCGMSLAMTDIGTSTGLGSVALAAGVVVGIAGIVLTALAYPVYLRVLKKERARIAPEILRLTDELMNDR